MNETVKRSISGLIYVILLIVAVLFSKESKIVLFAFFLAFATFEFCKINKLKFVVPILSSLTLYFLYTFYYNINIQKISVYLALISVFTNLYLCYWLFSKKTIVFSKTALNILAKTYIIIPFLLMFSLCIIVNEKNFIYYSYILLSIFIIIWVNDTFAYIVGKSIGKNKLFERISPKKTIEGFAGGLIFSILASLLLAKYWFFENYLQTIIIAILVSVFGTIGDLVESKFKRIANVKDSGNIMPGHGGILDRLDSVIFASPFVFLFIKFLDYVS